VARDFAVGVGRLVWDGSYLIVSYPVFVSKGGLDSDN
jgi:hypothetical protein